MYTHKLVTTCSSKKKHCHVAKKEIVIMSVEIVDNIEDSEMEETLQISQEGLNALELAL